MRIFKIDLKTNDFCVEMQCNEIQKRETKL